MKKRERRARRLRREAREIVGIGFSFEFRGQRVCATEWKGSPAYIVIRVPRLRKVIRMHSPTPVALKCEGQFGDQEFAELWELLTERAKEIHRLVIQTGDEMEALLQEESDLE